MKLTVSRAAALMGKGPMYVRIGLQRKLLDIGVAYKLTGSRWNYTISPGKLAAWLGIPVEELEKRVEGMQ